ncbi:MAG: hypothetical protein ACK55Z_08585, partial [bacterium]
FKSDYLYYASLQRKDHLAFLYWQQEYSESKIQLLVVSKKQFTIALNLEPALAVVFLIVAMTRFHLN